LVTWWRSALCGVFYVDFCRTFCKFIQKWNILEKIEKKGCNVSQNMVIYESELHEYHKGEDHMSIYDRALKDMLDTYAPSASEREQACATAINVLLSCAVPPQSNSEAVASVPREPETT